MRTTLNVKVRECAAAVLPAIGARLPGHSVIEALMDTTGDADSRGNNRKGTSAEAMEAVVGLEAAFRRHRSAIGDMLAPGADDRSRMVTKMLLVLSSVITQNLVRNDNTSLPPVSMLGKDAHEVNALPWMGPAGSFWNTHNKLGSLPFSWEGSPEIACLLSLRAAWFGLEPVTRVGEGRSQLNWERTVAAGLLATYGAGKTFVEILNPTAFAQALERLHELMVRHRLWGNDSVKSDRATTSGEPIPYSQLSTDMRQNYAVILLGILTGLAEHSGKLTVQGCRDALSKARLEKDRGDARVLVVYPNIEDGLRVVEAGRLCSVLDASKVRTRQFALVAGNDWLTMDIQSVTLPRALAAIEVIRTVVDFCNHARNLSTFGVGAPVGEGFLRLVNRDRRFTGEPINAEQALTILGRQVVRAVSAASAEGYDFVVSQAEEAISAVPKLGSENVPESLLALVRLVLDRLDDGTVCNLNHCAETARLYFGLAAAKPTMFPLRNVVGGAGTFTDPSNLPTPRILQLLDRAVVVKGLLAAEALCKGEWDVGTLVCPRDLLRNTTFKDCLRAKKVELIYAN